MLSYFRSSTTCAHKLFSRILMIELIGPNEQENVVSQVSMSTSTFWSSTAAVRHCVEPKLSMYLSVYMAVIIPSHHEQWFGRQMQLQLLKLVRARLWSVDSGLQWADLYAFTEASPWTSHNTTKEWMIVKKGMLRSCLIMFNSLTQKFQQWWRF